MDIFQERIRLAINAKKKSQLGLPRAEKTTITSIGKLIYPTVNEKTVFTRMNEFLTVRKSYKQSEVLILCKETGVDPNFLYGFKSKYDEILNDKKEDNE